MTEKEKYNFAVEMVKNSGYTDDCYIYNFEDGSVRIILAFKKN
jgi:hypothetical protein